MSIFIKRSDLKVKNPTTGTYQGQSLFTENDTQTQLNRITSAGTTQVNAVNAKGQETLASIPDDYTELSNNVDDLKSALSVNDKHVVNELLSTENVNTDKEITIDSWENDSAHGYGIINADFILTSLVDKILIYNTSTYAGYINYYDQSKTRTSYVYIGGDKQYVIDKNVPYFKVWFYKRDQSSITATDLSNIRFEKSRKITDAVSTNESNVNNALRDNGTWNNNLDYIIGGLSLAANRVGNPLFASASLSRIRSTVPMFVVHDNAIFKPSFDMTYQFMWAKVDANDVLLSFGGYVRGAILQKGKYIFLFKKKDGSAVSDADVTAISANVSDYYYFDDDAPSIDYSKLFCLNWYGEVDGKVRLGDATWTNFNASHTSVIIPEFYTDHDIYIKKNTSSYRLRDSVSDSEGNLLYSTGYITDTNMRRVPAGYHHIMIDGSSNYDDMSKSLDIYATKAEVAFIVPNKVIERNIDIQNALGAIRKPDKYSNSANRTVFIAQATDSHGDYVRWMDFLDVVNHYEPALVVHSGDMVNTDMLSDTSYFLDNLPSMPTLLAMGNHEVGAGHNIGSGGATNETLFNDLIEPLNEKYNFGATKTYYSYTTPNLQYTGGIKFIVLNVYDYDENDGTTFVDRTHIYYSQEQITWLIGELQNALTNNNPVVVVAHECDAYLAPADGGENPFNQTYEMARFYSKTWTGNPVCDLIEAFITGSSINQTYTETGAGITLTVNTSFASKGKFVTWLVGHRHADFMGFLPDYSQLVISPCATACSIDSVNSAQGYSDLPRREGDRCEDAFNLYAITPDANTIGIVRVGSNINYDLRERRYYKTSYVKSV